MYSSEAHLSVFEIETPEEKIENAIRFRNVAKNRCKTYRSGDRLECEIFPMWSTKAEVRRAKANKSRKAQASLNAWNRQKSVARYACENYAEGDYWGTVTYDKEHLPETMSEGNKIFSNFLRRVKRLYQKAGIEFKYICTTGGGRLHHHFMIPGGVDRRQSKNYGSTAGFVKCGAYRMAQRA